MDQQKITIVHRFVYNYFFNQSMSLELIIFSAVGNCSFLTFQKFACYEIPRNCLAFIEIIQKIVKTGLSKSFTSRELFCAEDGTLQNFKMLPFCFSKFTFEFFVFFVTYN